MRREIYTCDSCGITKKDTNHWYWTELSREKELVLHRFGSYLPDSCKHYCGRECLQKAVEIWTSERA